MYMCACITDTCINFVVYAMKSFSVLLVLLFASSWSRVLSHEALSGTSSINNSVNLGGLFAVHPDRGNGLCGKIRTSSFVNTQAMIYAVQTINADPNLLPGVSLTYDLRDTCGISNIALEETIDFMAEHGSPPVGGISGLVGPTQSDVSISVASLLRIFRVPQISYASTATVLSDRTRFEYFFRTIPPDRLQARAMASLIAHFNWSYIIGIHSDNSYGRGGLDALAEELSLRNESQICMVTDSDLAIPSHPSDEDFDRALRFVEQKWVQNATVVVFFGHQQKVRGLIDTIRRSDSSSFDNMTWIASDAWAANMPMEYHDDLRGLLGVTPRTNYVERFVEYYESVTPANHSGNPWFEKFWEREFNCSLGPAPESDKNPCGDSATRRLTYDNSTAGSTSDYVIDAVYAFAHALHNLIALFCPENSTGLCDEIMFEAFSQRVVDGDMLRDQLYNISFASPTSNRVCFDRTGNQQGFYDIVNLGRDGIKEIGTWSAENDLEITGDVEWRNGARDVPMSACSLPCGSGEERVPMSEHGLCCWTCQPCAGEDAISAGLACRDCSLGTSPNARRDACVDNPVRHLTWSNPWAMVILALTSLGLVTTAFVVVIFVVYNKHSIVKAASRELSAILLTGITFCYILPFFFIARPSPFTCTVRRFGISFCFSLCFSPLLMKTNRIYRVFHQAPRTPSCAGPKSQVFFTIILISVQVVISSVWLIVERPNVIYIHKSRVTELACGGSPYAFLPVSLLYNLLLLVLSTLYAFLARKIPERFNETKFITVTLYSICIIWLGIIPIYFATVKLGTIFQTGTLVFAVLLSASTTLLCLFVPKVVLVFVELRTPVKKKGFSRSPATTSFMVSNEDVSGFVEGFRRLD